MQYNIPQVWNVNKNIPVPLFKQLADKIKWSICLGNIADGSRLPPVRETAKELGLSVDTVRASYKMLETMGLVVTRPNYGTEVIKQNENCDDKKKLEMPRDDELLSLIVYYLSQGFSKEDILTVFMESLDKATGSETEKLLFVDCTEEDCRNFADQLLQHLNIPVDYMLVEQLDFPEQFRNNHYKAIITTYFHYSIVLQALKPLNLPIYGVVTELSNKTMAAIRKFPFGTKVGVICQPIHSTQYMISLIENIRSDLDIRSSTLDCDEETNQIIDWADQFFITHACTELIINKKPNASVYYFCDQINAQSIGILRENISSLG